jgi:hypothetical protein
MKYKQGIRTSEPGKDTSGMCPEESKVVELPRKLVNTCPSHAARRKRTVMERRIHAEVQPHPELNDSKSIKADCDPLVLLSYCVDPQGEDGMGEKGDQREVGDFEEHSPSTTEGKVNLGKQIS